MSAGEGSTIGVGGDAWMAAGDFADHEEEVGEGEGVTAGSDLASLMESAESLGLLSL